MYFSLPTSPKPIILIIPGPFGHPSYSVYDTKAALQWTRQTSKEQKDQGVEGKWAEAASAALFSKSITNLETMAQ